MLLLFLAGIAHAQSQLPVPVQTCSNTGSTCAFTNNVTSGNIVLIGAHSEAALTTPTDTLSTTWTLVNSRATGGAFAYLWCGIPSSSGADTITLNGTVSFGGQVSVEFPPRNFSCTADASAVGATTASPVTTSSITTSKNGDLAICYMADNHSGDIHMPDTATNWLLVTAQNGSDSSGMGFKFTGTNGSNSCKFIGTGTTGNYVFAAFAPSAVSIETTTLPTSSLTNSYSFTLQALGGVGAYTWSISSGSLPTGLSINSSTGAITGTPTGGSQTFTARVTDGTNSATKSLTLTVNSSASTITLTQAVASSGSPNTAVLTSVAVDDILTMGCWVNNSTHIFLPTDTKGSTWTYVGNSQVANIQISQMQTFYIGKVVASGSDTITTPNNTVCIVSQWAGAQAVASDTAVNIHGTSAATSTVTGASITTLAPNSLIVVQDQTWNSGSTSGAGSGFTQAATSSGATPMQQEYQTQSSTGSYTPTWTQTSNTSTNWNAWEIALRPGTSGTVSSGVVRHGAKVVF